MKRGRKSKHDWKSVNWKLPTKIIAAQLGVKTGAVSNARNKYAPSTVGRKTPILFLAQSKNLESGRAERWKNRARDWSQIDWSLSNLEIAALVKTNPTYVSLQRKKHDPRKTKMKTSEKQLALVRAWEKRNPERAQARKNAYWKTDKGKAAIKRRRKKFNAYRKRWRAEQKVKSGNDALRDRRANDQ